MAYAVTMLSWGLVEFEEEIAAANQLEHALEAIGWGADYFIKAHPQPNLLWAQVKLRSSLVRLFSFAASQSTLHLNPITPQKAYQITGDFFFMPKGS
ncbi:Endoglucanase 5 [Platanthera zijinensis]|uniref:cellulase n=1 Tax=Platanthera zijinensis TaxID=2320716 RepID=A0AAP0BQ77_9ASPA